MSTPTDNRLRDVLALLREVHDEPTTEMVVSWAANLLATLQKPYNISLMTTQLLTSPAIWSRPAAVARPLEVCIRFTAIFKGAAAHVHDKAARSLEPSRYWTPPSLDPDLWANAVACGISGQPDRWKHVLVMAGLLSGIRSADVAADFAGPTYTTSLAGDRRLGTQTQLELAVAQAANMGLAEIGNEEDTDRRLLAEAAMTLAVAHACPLLTETSARYHLNLDALTPIALRAVTHHKEGLQDCTFMGGIEADVIFDRAGRSHWPQTSKSFEDVQRVAANPLIVALGPLSQVLAFAASHTGSADVVTGMLNELLGISGALSRGWAASPLAELEHDQAGLSAATREQTLPALLQLQRNVMYACLLILRAILDRAIWDSRLAPRIYNIATNSLSVLKNLSFVTLRPGNSSFGTYQASYMAAIDVLANCRASTFQFLRGMLPPAMAKGLAHASAVQKTQALFYMGLAEHLPAQLSQNACRLLVIDPASAILATPHAAGPTDVALYEAAHSALLAVFACPQHSALTAQQAVRYTDQLCADYPARISARQFRLGFKSVVKYLFPPHCLVPMGEQLASAALEMICNWAAEAGSTVLAAAEDGVGAAPMTEQGVLVLTLVDVMPVVPVADLEEWLVAAAERLGEIADPAVRAGVRERLLTVLTSGELDVERAAVAAAWWGTHGGQRLVEGENRTQL